MDEVFDPILLEAVQAFQDTAAKIQVPTLLVGAFARDLYLRESPQHKHFRKTKDVDFAVLVESWDKFYELRNKLLASKLFTAHPNQNIPHKVFYQNIFELDLVPFGSIVAEDGRLHCWPEKFEQTMNLMGFNEAFQSSVFRRIGQMSIRTLTLESIVVLKLISWNDTKDRTKDAIDLAILIKEHANLPERNELLWSDEHIDLLDLEPEYIDQVTRMLGRQITQIKLDQSTLEHIKHILNREAKSDSNDLAVAMRQQMEITQSKKAFAKILLGINDLC